MKKTLYILVLAALSALALSGCGYTMFTSPTVGGIYTGTTSPSDLTMDTTQVGNLKTGTAECMSVLAIAAWGDCSVEAAMKSGGIKKIHHVDHQTFSIILGVYNKYTTVVYGE
jgi:hypothetical protein